MSRIFTFIFAIGVLCGCSGGSNRSVSIVPLPVEMVQSSGSYTLDRESVIVFNSSDQRLSEIADLAAMVIKNYSGLELNKASEGRGITLSIVENPSENSESYRLKVSSDGILIEAPTSAGIFYGVQTLAQMVDPVPAEEVEIACVEIEDYPRLEWRGLHLDVGRHFFTKEEVMKFIDVMSRYKLNKFHWHLTEDQGWRVEIKKYPLLTEVAAWRKCVGFADNQKRGYNEDDGKPYGGFYTQEEIREVVEYARLRQVEVIPEIELPGHAVAAIAAYPDLYCFPSEKQEPWIVGGVSDGVYCAGKESTFAFLEDIFSEIIELFPSKYIHIGGDEAPKNNWSRCPACQRRIKAEGLEDEFELQSYFIERIEKFLNAHGREIIGWDEIMEGGLSKSATVMSWRGTTPGIEAAEMGNKVIMTPYNLCYVSQPQSINSVTKFGKNSPVVTMYDLYNFNPVPEHLSAKDAKNIVGVEACHWSEGSPNFHILMYKSYPRSIALAEIGWTPQEKRSWESFYPRVTENLKYLDKMGVAHGERSSDVRISLEPDATSGKVMLKLACELPGSLHYTMDGSEPTRESKIFDGAQVVDKSSSIKAVMYDKDGMAGRIASEDIYFHKALGKGVKYNIFYSDKHPGGGDLGLTNGVLGKWQGFEKRDVDMVIDLGAEMEFSTIRSDWFYDISDYVHKPIEVTYEISSDGNQYEQVFLWSYSHPANLYNVGTESLVKSFDNTVTARYIRVKAKNIMTNPLWHKSAGAGAWLFVDEIIVE